MSDIAISHSQYSIKITDAVRSAVGKNNQLSNIKYYFANKDFRYGYDYTIKIVGDDVILTSDLVEIRNLVENEIIIAAILLKSAF